MRPPGTPLPCRMCPKSKDGRPNPGADMTSRNARALALYYQIRAGTPMPDDALVKLNCGIIERVLSQVTLLKQDVSGLALALFGKAT